LFVLAQSAGASDAHPAAPESATATAQGSAPADFRQLLPPDTPVRLMVLREITSRNAHAGERFRLRVDEPIFINGKPVVSVGATAWGEIVSFQPSGAAGKAGRIGAKLLWLELPEGRVPLVGEIKRKGGGNGDGLALAIVGFGILGLLNAGDSARLHGGDLLTAFVGKVDAPAAVAADAATEKSSGEPAAQSSGEPAAALVH
jgi:hypothetical protein